MKQFFKGLMLVLVIGTPILAWATPVGAVYEEEEVIVTEESVDEIDEESKSIEVEVSK